MNEKIRITVIDVKGERMIVNLEKNKRIQDVKTILQNEYIDPKKYEFDLFHAGHKTSDEMSLSHIEDIEFIPFVIQYSYQRPPVFKVSNPLERYLNETPIDYSPVLHGEQNTASLHQIFNRIEELFGRRTSTTHANMYTPLHGQQLDRNIDIPEINIQRLAQMFVSSDSDASVDNRDSDSNSDSDQSSDLDKFTGGYIYNNSSSYSTDEEMSEAERRYYMDLIHSDYYDSDDFSDN